MHNAVETLGRVHAVIPLAGMLRRSTRVFVAQAPESGLSAQGFGANVEGALATGCANAPDVAPTRFPASAPGLIEA